MFFLSIFKHWGRRGGRKDGKKMVGVPFFLTESKYLCEKISSQATNRKQGGEKYKQLVKILF